MSAIVASVAPTAGGASVGRHRAVATAADPSVSTIACDTPRVGQPGMVPSEVGERYGLTSLWQAGFTGQHVRVALIEIGTKVDADVLERYEDCIGVPHVPFVAHQLDTGPATPSGESMSDAEMIVGLAPGIARLDEFFSATTPDPFVDLLRMALTPANTGGELPDIVSISFNSCESQYVKKYSGTEQTEQLLQYAASHGVWVFKGAGDSGSSACAKNGTCKNTDTELAVDYPASSQWVIGTGGIMVDPGTASDAVSTLGTTWAKSDCGGTGGGLSARFAAPDWQHTVPGGLTDAHRMVPDIASLAGSPGYQLLTPSRDTKPTEPIEWVWQATQGDSMTGPFHAAAFAAVRSALAAQGVSAPIDLHPVLYEIPNDPASYPLVFRDVTEGSNAFYGNTCCRARVGYDLTTGLGQIVFDQLVRVLVAEARRPVVAAPTFTG